MPCTMTGSLSGDLAMERDEAVIRGSKATQAACAAFRLLDPDQIQSLTPEIQRWWRLHQKADGLDSSRDFIEQSRLRAGIED